MLSKGKIFTFLDFCGPYCYRGNVYKKQLAFCDTRMPWCSLGGPILSGVQIRSSLLPPTQSGLLHAMYQWILRTESIDTSHNLIGQYGRRSHDPETDIAISALDDPSIIARGQVWVSRDRKILEYHDCKWLFFKFVDVFLNIRFY